MCKILIFSDINDQSSAEVVEWLIYKKANFRRLNGEINLGIKNIAIKNKTTNIDFVHDGFFFSTKSIKSFWYRRGYLNKIQYNISDDILSSYFLKDENEAAKFFLINELDKKAKINQIYTSVINKLLKLQIAAKCEFNIPETLVTSNKKSVDYFLEKKKSIITKSLQSSFFAITETTEYSLLTNAFTKSDLKKTPPNFFLTKFQENIKKQFELRIFYLDAKFYSMAIFSQKNPKTAIDFRNYDNYMPNRNVPFKLPTIIKNKIIRLMSILKLKSGSIDMLVTDNNEYYFLEVNPVGQFGMVSHPCNYYIEKIIAEKLL